MTEPATQRLADLYEQLRVVERELELPSSDRAARDWARRKKDIEAVIVKVKASLPPSHMEAMSAAGFEALAWQPIAIEVICADGSIRSEWLPEDLIHWEKRRFIRWRTDDGYAFAGWEPKTDNHSGGRYRTVHHAFGWYAWSDAQGQSA